MCKLHKAIYGLKQAPRAWFDKLRNALLLVGFTNSKADSFLFVQTDSKLSTYVLVYVDDIIITVSNQQRVEEIILQLNKQFSLKDLDILSYFLGIEVLRSSTDSWLLTQTKYITDLLVKTKMNLAHSLPTPMATGVKLSSKDGDPFEDVTL